MAIYCPTCHEINFETIQSATTCRACGDDLHAPATVELLPVEDPVPLTPVPPAVDRPTLRANWIAAVFGTVVLGGGAVLAVLSQGHFSNVKTATAQVSERPDAKASYTVDGRTYSIAAPHASAGAEFTVYYDPTKPAAASTTRPLTVNTALLGGLLVGTAGLVLIALAFGVGGDFLLLRSAARNLDPRRAEEPSAEPR